MAGIVTSMVFGSKATTTMAGGTAEANRIAQEGLDFNMQAYEDTMEQLGALEDIFGPVRENLGKYYNSISPEMLQMQSKERIESQYDQATKNLDAQLSNSGMFKSGQALDARTALESSRAELTAQSGGQAMQQYNQEQMNWLNVGLGEMAGVRGQATQQQGQVSNAFSNQANIAFQGGQQMANMYSQQSQDWGQFATGAMQLGGYAAGGGFSGTSLAPKFNTNTGSAMFNPQTGERYK